MESTNNLLKNRSFEDLQKAFKESGGESRVDEKTLKKSKDIGGWLYPNATQIPNEFFDKLMPLLSESELKVTLYIARKTFGYGKAYGDKIPLSQILEGTLKKNGERIDFGTGLSKKSALSAISKLEMLGVIKVERSRNVNTGERSTNFYSLNIRDDYSKV